MIKRFSTYYATFCMILDGLLVIASLRLAQIVRPFIAPFFDFAKEIRSPQPISLYLQLLVALVWVLILMRLGLYDPEENLRIVDETFNLLSGALISITVTAGMFYIVKSDLSRLVFVLFFLIAPLLLFFHRAIYRLAFKRKWRKRTNPHRILVVGAGIVGRRFEDECRRFDHLGYDLVGFVDDNPEIIKDAPDVLGTLEQTVALINEHQIDHLVVALPRWAHDSINAIVEGVHQLPVLVWVIPDYFALMLSKSSVWNFAGMPMINLRAPALNNRQRLTKAIFDLALALPLFLLTLPLFGLIALGIKLDSEGPVFYRSLRLKENGQPFEMIKFRTMVKNAHQQFADVVKKDENGALVHKRPEDERVTRVGKLLRKTSLDELPQLLNIIKGDMSLVGPRPELPEMVKHYQPWQYKRFAVPQGLTGWWQVNGRSDKPMHLHTNEDLHYIQNYSIWLDLQILIKTVIIVLRGKGAY